VPTFDKIRGLAYKIWEEEGRPQGMDVEHYLRAKAILDRQEAERIPQLAAPEPIAELPPAPVYVELATAKEQVTPSRKRAPGIDKPIIIRISQC
jgi:hypothetical protein